MNSVPNPINPIAIEFGPISIHWYGVIIALGASLGLYLAIHEGKKRGIASDTLVDLIMYALPIAIISARVYYVVFEWPYFKNHLNQIPAIWNGGIAIHGGLIGAIVTAIIFTRKRNISFWKVADITAPGILLAQAIGRWGNFINQEAHGGPVSRTFLEHLHLPAFIINQMYIDGLYFHPTFLYESIWSFTGVIILLTIRKKFALQLGELFLCYLVWYSTGRFFIEGMRTDSLMLTPHLRMAQVISILIISFCITFGIFRKYKYLSKERFAK
ncbi:prolipoprotein diacylglyceryl transferase [Fictibacillus fluitans]|uniref:Phosphatidylglycerol--prolipoprotein diacylglyceryl transferase n=1 Tax=Fictibacillus fluitans TaxID=3058422 RepID=A0ABT8HRE1_9BACL|nr:prolipoprotein diacylglyceryl transferase [Fictibacillus sp. NE201]MDN4523328.1 prolipoprotein diacylglyceryl transferase [Fictibacillus sp. NE201]